MTINIDQALNFEPPTRQESEKSFGLLRRYFAPESIGVENIDPAKPTLFVGNHTRFGMLDVPLIAREIYLATGVYPRGLSDRVHYKVPYWRDALTRSGGVIGSREMCRALMEAGESIMVFPGGGREVWRGRDKNYQLLWQNRMGFARMALESGYSITPFCSVGPDEVFDVGIDGEDIMKSPLGNLIQSLSNTPKDKLKESIVPIPRGIGLSALPRPEKFYFAFGKPIQATGKQAAAEDKKEQRKVQRQTAKSIDKLLAETLLHRAQRKTEQSIWRRLLQKS